jgi:hypothetical protein
MEIDRNRKEQLRGKEAVPVSLNLYTIIIDENQEKVERGREEKEGGLFFQSTCHGKRRGIERSDTQENTKCPTTYRVPRPSCTKCTKTSLGFLAVRLSPQEPKKCYI